MTKIKESPEENGDRVKIQSLWIKPSSWAKLSTIKNGLGLTWSQVTNIWIEQLIQSNIVPKEVIDEIRVIEKENGNELPESYLWRETFAIGTSWTKAGGLLKQIQEECTLLNNSIEELITTIEDHADAMLSINEETTLSSTEKS